MAKKVKVIVMFSGGLDSRLAVKIMQEQRLNIWALFFKLPFSKNIENDIKKFSKKEKIKLKIFDCTKGKLFREYLELIKNPKYGRGTGMNPCIDCRIFILKKAKEFAGEKGIKIIVTGEVLGERPMSQMKRAMDIIEKESGLKGRLLRPLSARVLPETEAEKKGLVDREKFCDIRGRRREKQIALAKRFKISYPTPAGGCLLCEKLYCEKLKKILDKKDLSYDDIQLLKIGRHFEASCVNFDTKLPEASQIILGKNKKENELLEKGKGIKIIPKQIGPTALIKNKKYQKKAEKLIQKYSKHKIENFTIKN